MALDDPEGWEVYRQILVASQADPMIHVFTNLTGVGNVEVNAFQRLSDVVVQKSIREGFGLVVSEALWKATPVVAGRAGGIPLQMADGMESLLLNELSLLASLGAPQRPAWPDVLRDPVCGMALQGQQGLPTAQLDGRQVLFCSKGCGARFSANPQRYLGHATRTRS